MNKQLSLTQGSIWKGLLLFALPVFLGQLFQQFYNAFDSWCVGNFIGADALAAVGSSGSLIFMLVSFFNGLSMGAGVVIARHFGGKEYDTMRKVIHTAIAFGLVTGLVISEGDHVSRNDPLLTIEAMKMETTVTSKISGIVDKLYVRNGDEINQDDLLVSFIVLDDLSYKQINCNCTRTICNSICQFCLQAFGK